MDVDAVADPVGGGLRREAGPPAEACGDLAVISRIATARSAAASASAGAQVTSNWCGHIRPRPFRARCRPRPAPPSGAARRGRPGAAPRRRRDARRHRQSAGALELVLEARRSRTARSPPSVPCSASFSRCACRTARACRRDRRNRRRRCRRASSAPVARCVAGRQVRHEPQIAGRAPGVRVGDRVERRQAEIGRHPADAGWRRSRRAAPAHRPAARDGGEVGGDDRDERVVFDPVIRPLPCPGPGSGPRRWRCRRPSNSRRRPEAVS